MFLQSSKQVIVIVMLLAIKLIAQQETYLIPDIAAPGMNTYIEIIGRQDTKNYYGPDGLRLNNKTDIIRIELVNPSDTNRVTFGPIATSWEGRMISTQVFVHDNVEPPSWDFNINGPQFTVLFRVNNNGNLSEEYALKIVKPFPFGDKSTSLERRLGTGTLGKRSPRGAMIVDSMVLANATYDVSLEDCDGSQQGNQGYLPFVLISKGKIQGGPNTIISVSAGQNGDISNGGPGGGGGAGYYRDASPLFDTDQGSDGGSGFTGGGGGGRNTFSPSSRNGGTGTGPNNSSSLMGGFSFNRVVGGMSVSSNRESSGGGTGHPFGTSGLAWTGGGIPDGGYGGGSGAGQNNRGGSGSNATNGESGQIPNGALPVGNSLLVPLAGGGGGASGNPQNVGVSSGRGGGGGGAMRIFAKNFNRLLLHAKGSNVGGGSPDGGAGAGGSIELGAKLGPNIIDFDVEGGKRSTTLVGGAGRVRVDAPIKTANVQPNTTATQFFGFTSDTSNFVGRKFEYKGTIDNSNPPVNSLNLWIKPKTGSWKQLGIATITGNTWKFDVDLTNENDKEFFVVVMADFGGADVQQYTYRPRHLFSQAAANYWKVDVFADITSSKTITTRALRCESKVDSVLIENPGTDILNFTTTGFTSIPNNPFQLDGNFTPTIAPNGKLWLKYSFTPRPGFAGLVKDSIRIFSNAKDPNKSPWVIYFDGTILEYKFKYTNVTNPRPSNDTLWFRNSCVGNVETILVDIKNESGVEIEIDKIDKENSTDLDFSLDALVNKKIIDQGTTRAQFKYSDTDGNASTIGTSFLVFVKGCTNPVDTIHLRINVFNAKFELQSSLDTNFGDTRVSSNKQRTLTFTNTGLTSAYVSNITNGTNFKVKAVRPPLPAVINSKEKLEVDIEFTPTAETTYSETFTIQTIVRDTSCDGTRNFTLRGRGVQSGIEYVPQVLDFLRFKHCQRGSDLNVNIRCVQGSPSGFTILGEEIVGVGKELFSISSRPASNILNPGDPPQLYALKFIPLKGYSGVYNAELLIFVNDNQIKDTLRVSLKGNVEALNVTFDKIQPLQFGDVAIGEKKDLPLKLTNNGPSQRSIVEIRSSPEISVTPQTQNLAPNGGFVDLNVSFSPISEGLYSNTITVLFGGIDCYDTLFYDMRGNGLKGDIDTTGTLDFGVLTPCQEKFSTLELKNTGQAAVTIENISIIGQDQNKFLIPSNLSNVSLSVGSNAPCTVTFTNKNSSNTLGEFKADIIFVVKINGVSRTLTRTATAKVLTGLKPTFGPLDFGNVIVGTSKSLTFTLEKDPEATFNVDMLAFGALVPNSDFVVDVTQIQNLPLSNFLYAVVTYSPTAVDADYGATGYDFTMGDINCRTNSFFDYKGNGVPAAKLDLWIDNVEFDPTEKNVKIPIKSRLVDGVELLGGFKIDVLQLRFNQSLFYPTSLSSGTILSMESQAALPNGQRDLLLSVAIDNINIDKKAGETTISNIIGNAMLGDATFTPISVESIVYSQKNLVSSIENSIKGGLSIKVCNEGGPRLLTSTNPINIKKQFINQSLDLELTMPEIGKYEFSVFDLTGLTVFSTNFTKELGSTDIKYLSINTDLLNSGKYFLLLKSPNREKLESITITK